VDDEAKLSAGPVLYNAGSVSCLAVGGHVLGVSAHPTFVVNLACVMIDDFAMSQLLVVLQSRGRVLFVVF
jgi:hypothetical protein